MQISNSEVETEQACQWKHYMAFGLGLQKNPLSRPLRTGIFGHALLREYYDALKGGYSARDAISIAHAIAVDEKNRNDYGRDVCHDVGLLFLNYVIHYADDVADFEIEEVEQTRVVNLEDDLDFRFTPDLLVRLKTDIHVTLVSGAFMTFSSGSYLLFDHKFSSRPFTQAEMLMNAQLPKYIWGLRELGFNVSGACFNQVNYTGNSREPFQRSWVAPSEERIQGFMKQHLKAARRIAANRKLPVAEYRKVAEKSFNKLQCGHCAFRIPCSIDINGGDISKILATDYVENTYVRQSG